MEKLSSKIILIISFVLISLKGLSQNVPKQNAAIETADSLGVVLVQPDDESFKVQYKNRTLMEGALWDKNKISVIIIPLNDSLAEKLTYSNSKVLISKRQVKLIKGNYLEDGFSYYFTEKGILSHVYQYKKGVINGVYILYFENGTVNIKGFYSEGDKSGIWEYYDEKGKFLKREKFN